MTSCLYPGLWVFEDLALFFLLESYAATGRKEMEESRAKSVGATQNSSRASSAQRDKLLIPLHIYS